MPSIARLSYDQMVDQLKELDNRFKALKKKTEKAPDDLKEHLRAFQEVQWHTAATTSDHAWYLLLEHTRHAEHPV